MAAEAPSAGAVEVRTALREAQAAVVDAAAALADALPETARERIATARAAAVRPGTSSAAARRAIRRLDRARDITAPLGPADAIAPALRELQRAATALRDAEAALGSRGIDGCVLVESGGSAAAIHGAGRAVRLRLVPRSAAAFSVLNDDPARTVVAAGVVPLGGGRFRAVWGTDLGAATISADCGPGATLRAFCAGRPGALETAPPGPPDYGGATVYLREGTAGGAPSPATVGDAPLTFAVAPELPPGLSLDRTTGAISGTPSASGPAAAFTVTVRNARSSASATVVIDVDPPLPEGVVDLEGGFAIEALAEVPAIPVKLAALADGRLLVSELTTGNVRVVDPITGLLPAPLVAVPILAGPEQGLFGLAPAPDFDSTGELFVLASAPAEGGHADRNRILRYVALGGTVTGPDIVVDDLPLAGTQNGGHLAFGPDGHLYATTGDTGDEVLAQSDASLAGRVLRFARDGTIPAGNPFAGSPEWARGFRNPFAFAFDRATGNLFATENGPAAHDELDFVQAGKNFGWGAPEGTHFGALTGIRLIDWTPVIVPTGIASHDGTQFGAAHAGNLFLGSYDLAVVRRLTLEGIDVTGESDFVRFDEQGIAQKPLDVIAAPDGSLVVSTFSTVWRVRRD